MPPDLSSEAAASAVDVGRIWTLRSTYTLGLLTLITTLSYFDRSVFSILLPLIQHDIHLSDTAIGLVAGAAFILFYSIAGIPVARMADLSSRRFIIGVGMAFWSVMTMLTGCVGNLIQLVATRFLMGAGEAGGAAPVISVVSDLFGGRQRALALAVLTSGAALSSLVLTPAAGWLGHRYGWRPVYWGAGASGLVLTLLFLATVRDPERGRWDARVEEVKADSLLRVVGFLLSRRAYLFTILGGSMVMVAAFGNIVWGPTFLVRVHHVDVAQAAVLTGPITGVLGVIGAFSAGSLADFLSGWNPRWRIWLPALACVAVGPTQFIFLYAPSIYGLLIGQGLYSLFWGMTVPLLYAVLLELVPARMRAVGMSVYLLIINIVGQVIGPLVVGLLNDSLGPRLGEAAIRYSMTATACCAFVSGAFFLAASFWFIEESRSATAS
jgi:MFS family permease